MSVPRRLALASALLVSAIAGILPAAAASEEAASIQSVAVRDLWEKVKARCVTPGMAPLVVDNVGISPRNTLASQALRDLMRTKLDAAFSDLFQTERTGIRRELDPADLDVLRAYANADAFGPNKVVDRYRATYLMATADLASDSLGQYLLTLTVRGIGDGEGRCLETSEPVVLPEDQVGDPIVSLDHIFMRAANEMLKRTKGNTTLYLSAEVAGEGTAPSRWTETFVDETRYALQNASREQGTQNLASDGPPIIVQPNASQVSPDSQRWEGQVKIERKRNSYRVLLTVAPNSGHITERGLIPSDALPPIPVEQLEDVEYNTAGGKLIEIGEEQQVFAGTFDEATDIHDYAFRLEVPHYVEIDAARLSGETDPVAALYAMDGSQVEPLKIVTKSQTLRRFRLDAGNYRLRVQNTGGKGSEYRMGVRGADSALYPLLPVGYQLTRVFQDWQVGIGEQNGQRACFAVTVANRWAPQDWRPIRPFIWFVVPDRTSTEGQDNIINQRFDVANYYDPQSPIQAAVFGSGRNWPLPIRVRDNQLQSLQDDEVMSLDSLEGMTQGSTLTLNATTADGRLAFLEYSLRGYQAAINEILTVCGRKELRQALIRR